MNRQKIGYILLFISFLLTALSLYLYPWEPSLYGKWESIDKDEKLEILKSNDFIANYKSKDINFFGKLEKGKWQQVSGSFIPLDDSKVKVKIFGLFEGIIEYNIKNSILTIKDGSSVSRYRKIP